MVSFESNSRRHPHRNSATNLPKVPSEVHLPQRQQQQVPNHTTHATASSFNANRAPSTAPTNESPSKRRRQSLDTLTPNAAAAATSAPSPVCQQPPRIRILPGSSWLTQQLGGSRRNGTVAQPPPPSGPPPPPAMVLPVMMVGPNLSGKTSLLQSFVQRIQVGPSNQNQHFQQTAEQSDMSFRTTRTGKSSSGFTTTIPWNISYYKKDIAYQHSNGTIRSLRWQFWDVSSALSTNTSTAEPSIQEPCSHLKRVFAASLAVIIAVSMYPFDIESILDQIRQWHSWIRSTLQYPEQEKRTIFVCLTRADCCWDQHTTPMGLMRLGGALTSLCEELSIDSWFVTTATHHDDNKQADAIDTVFQTMAEHVIARFEQDNDNENDEDDDDEDNHSVEWRFHSHYSIPSPIKHKRS